jgi:hypothetical protein
MFRITLAVGMLMLSSSAGVTRAEAPEREDCKICQQTWFDSDNDYRHHFTDYRDEATSCSAADPGHPIGCEDTSWHYGPCSRHPSCKPTEELAAVAELLAGPDLALRSAVLQKYAAAIRHSSDSSTLEIVDCSGIVVAVAPL